MNIQQIFNKVSNHLLSQKKKSLLENIIPPDTIYGYRGMHRTMCSIGCLIDEKFYNPSLEGFCISDKSVKNALNLSGISTEENSILFFLDRLQFIHDELDPEEWDVELIKLAINKKLDITCLQKFLYPNIELKK
jgi:hypothetical protein